MHVLHWTVIELLGGPEKANWKAFDIMNLIWINMNEIWKKRQRLENWKVCGDIWGHGQSRCYLSRTKMNILIPFWQKIKINNLKRKQNKYPYPFLAIFSDSKINVLYLFWQHYHKAKWISLFFSGNINRKQNKKRHQRWM